MRLFQILFTLLVLSTSLSAQIHGNKNLKTISQNVEGLTSIDIQFNANITLDYSLDENMIIVADENILEYIGVEFENGKLTLDQIKWIEPSTMPTITIGVPNLQSVFQGTHSTTFLKDVKGQSLFLRGNVGKIKAQGKITSLTVSTTGTDMDLSQLEIENASITIDDDSKVIVDKVGSLQSELSRNAQLVCLSEIKNMPEYIQKEKGNSTKVNPNLKWIDFRIKNNSLKRNHFVVVGPKKDGSKFSYGFSLFPSISKKERWSVGTQIFREKRSGSKELLVTISAKDEGTIVPLFN